jgi:hypothetical protein
LRLVPLLVHYGIDVFAAFPDQREYWKRKNDLHVNQRATSGDSLEDLRHRESQLDDEYNWKSRAASRVHFFVEAPIGIAVTLIGPFVSVPAIGGGLMLGGMFTFSDGCFWHWDQLPAVGRFIVLMAAFFVLIWIGYQRLSDLRT